MKAKHRRLTMVLLGMGALTVSGLLAASALKNQAAYFYSPADIRKLGGVPAGRAMRLGGMVADKSVFREALAPAYEYPERVSDDTIDAYLQPLLASSQLGALERFVNAFDCRHTLAIEDRLRRVQAPAPNPLAASDAV